jgi:uncharacterized protein (DUF2141 family)
MILIKQLLALILMLLHLILSAQTDDNTTDKSDLKIIVKVNNILSNKGNIKFSIFDSEENFDQKIIFKNSIGIIEGTQSEVIFENIPKGIYAIICYHDENENNQLDFDNFIPLESWGASRNPSLYGPPRFNATKFEVTDKDLNLEINF